MPDTNYSLEAEALAATPELPAYNYHPVFPVPTARRSA